MGWAGGWCVQETGQAWLSEGQRENPRAWGLVSKGSVEVRAGRPAEEGVFSTCDELRMETGNGVWGRGGGWSTDRDILSPSLFPRFSAAHPPSPGWWHLWSEPAARRVRR